MTAVIFISGLFFGLVMTMIVITAYNRIADDREAQARMRYEENQRRDKLRRDLNAPRDPMARRIMEQTRKELKEREEG